jgi:hypothetical protein
MKRVLLAAVAFSTVTMGAAAEPKRMADADMRRITAGFVDQGGLNVGVGDVTVSPTIGPVVVNTPVVTNTATNVAVSTAVATAVLAFGDQVSAAASNYDEQVNELGLGVSSSVGSQ